MEPLSIAALITSVVGVLGWYSESRRKNREETRKSTTEPVEAITQGAATLAAAVEAVIGPLRSEIDELRDQIYRLSITNERLELRVRELTNTLITHGIAVPEEKWGRRNNDGTIRFDDRSAS